jgi:hypothetical protein
MEKAVMKHPNEADLALYAGHDLNFVSEWRVGRHVAQCGDCRDSVDVFRSLRLETVRLGELPADIAWNRLASEMKANIRLGLEAGQCVAGGADEGSRWSMPAFSGARTMLAYASLVALVVAGVWLQRPATPTAQLRLADSGATVMAATGGGIELSAGGRSLGLRYGASQDINYSADAKGAMGARYVDSSTGYVTVVKVNVE